jgi:hypothetical protein
MLGWGGNMVRGWIKVLCVLLGANLAAQAPIPTPTLSLSACGLVGDGRHDDTVAFQKALDEAHGRRLEGVPGAVYRITAALRLPEDVDLDLQMGRLDLEGKFNTPFGRKVVEGAPLNLARLPTAGESVLELEAKPPTDLPIGSLVTLRTQALGGRMPPMYAHILRIEGTRLHLDQAVPCEVPGPAQVVPAPRRGRFRIAHGWIDASKAEPMVQFAWLQGYEQVRWEDVTISGVRGGEGNILAILNCLDVDIRQCHLRDFSLNVSGEAINVWDSRRVSVVGNDIDGEGFGIAVVRSDEVLIQENHLRGRVGLPRRTSVRGVKVIGCRGAKIISNHIEDYSTGVKSEDSGQTQILGNTIRGTAPSEPTSFAIGASNQHPDPRYHGGLRIEGNIVQRCGGIGIFLDAGSPRSILRKNRLEDLGTFGIYLAAAQGLVEGNTILRPGQARPSPAIQATRSSRVVDNGPRGPGGEALAATFLEEPKS